MKRTPWHQGRHEVLNSNNFRLLIKTYRRRLNVRGSETNDPIYVEPAILSALELYMESSLEEISCLTAKFLHLFIVESPFLEPFEFDNFILQNGKLIAQWYEPSSVFILRVTDIISIVYGPHMTSRETILQPFERTYFCEVYSLTQNPSKTFFVRIMTLQTVRLSNGESHLF